MIKLTGVRFILQFIGDGISTSLVADLTKDAASLYPQNNTVVSSPGEPQFTKGFAITTVTGVSGLTGNGPFTVTGTVTAGTGKINLTFSSAPANGTTFTVEGILIF